MTMRERGIAGFAGCALALLALVGLPGCDGSAPAEGAAPKAPPVRVATPLARDVTDWDEYTGRFEAVDAVDVRARVGGYIDSIHFGDGAKVERGDLLFVIDPRPFRIALQQAEAELVSARSRVQLADRDLERAGRLLKNQNIAQATYDERLQARQAADAAVQVAQAALDNARLQLEFTEVRSPVAGRAGRHLVDVGNLINGGTATSTLLTRIVSTDPIHLSFEVNQDAYLRYTRLDRTGERLSSRDAANLIWVRLQDETDWKHPGWMNFVDNEIDAGTGTIRGRAILENKDGLFAPGLFARLRLSGSGRYPAVLVPDAAIGSDQAGRFVVVIDADNKASFRPVITGPMVDGLRVVRSGLAADDRIVVGGLQRVRNGAAVTPVPATIEATPAP